jgi:hypothetical protein
MNTTDYDETQAARERQRLVAYEERTGLRRSRRTTILAERRKQQQAAALRSRLAALVAEEAKRPRPTQPAAQPRRKRVKLSTRSTTLADYRREAQATGCGCQHQPGSLAAAGSAVPACFRCGYHHEASLDCFGVSPALRPTRPRRRPRTASLSYHETVRRGLPV